jgi:hypothetical protein
MALERGVFVVIQAGTAQALVVQLEAQGLDQVQGRLANWRLQRESKDLLLRVVAARPLRGEWRAEEVDGRWRLTVSLAHE